MQEWFYSRLARIVQGRPIRTVIFLSGFILFAGMALTAYQWGATSAKFIDKPAIPITGPSLTDRTSFSLQPTGTVVSNLLTQPTQLIQLAVPNCPQPVNWSPYLVNPSDSLYRLSVTFGVDVNQLQQANCLPDIAMILPGQVIYVPRLIQSTPVPPTATPTPTMIPVIIPTQNSVQSSKPNPPPVAPPPVVAPTNKPNPPTLAPQPPTSVPPTPKPPGKHKKTPQPDNNEQ